LENEDPCGSESSKTKTTTWFCWGGNVRVNDQTNLCGICHLTAWRIDALDVVKSRPRIKGAYVVCVDERRLLGLMQSES
jgi:hypothetical protein